jgi:hypothetical protein
VQSILPLLEAIGFRAGVLFVKIMLRGNAQKPSFLSSSRAHANKTTKNKTKKRTWRRLLMLGISLVMRGISLALAAFGLAAFALAAAFASPSPRAPRSA